MSGTSLPPLAELDARKAAVVCGRHPADTPRTSGRGSPTNSVGRYRHVIVSGRRWRSLCSARWIVRSPSRLWRRISSRRPTFIPILNAYVVALVMWQLPAFSEDLRPWPAQTPHKFACCHANSCKDSRSRFYRKPWPLLGSLLALRCTGLGGAGRLRRTCCRWQLVFEQLEPLVDGPCQAELAVKHLDGADATAGDAPSLRGGPRNECWRR